MPVVKVTIHVEIDDIPVPSFPIVRRMKVPEVQTFNIIRGPASGSSTLATSELSNRRIIILQSNRGVEYRFNGGSQIFSTDPNCLVLFFDTSQTGNVFVNNTDGVNSANIRAFIGGA